VKVGVAALLSEAGHSFTGIGKKNELDNGLLSKITVGICER
jgi:hypothetical protein